MNEILLEWKMIIRNKRLSQMLILMLLLTAFFYFLLMPSNFLIKNYFVCRMLFLVGLFSLPGTYYGVLSLGMMASFMEKIVTSPMPLYRILLAKYYLYSLYSTGLLHLFLTVNMGISRWELLAAYLFSTGFMLLVFFRCMLLSYQPVDIRGMNFQNWQRSSLLSEFLAPVMIMTAAAGFMAALEWLAGETLTLLVMSVIGVGFIALHRWWMKSICKAVYKTKYRRLECFRENKIR